MFSFQPNGHFVYGTPTTSTTSQGYQIHDDLLTDLHHHHHDLMETNLISFGSSGNDDDSKRFEISNFEPWSSLPKERKNECSTIRKVMHREVERKRREEMSGLYSSLRSLLPLSQIKIELSRDLSICMYEFKGKRSVCDQIEEAAKHIKEKEKSIEELRIRRDELRQRKSCNYSVRRSDETCVTVNQVSDGMEILISGSSDLGLSPLLAVLLGRDLHVVSCISTRTNDRFLHKINIQAPPLHMMNIDVSELQDTLSDAIIYQVI